MSQQGKRSKIVQDPRFPFGDDTDSLADPPRGRWKCPESKHYLARGLGARAVEAAASSLLRAWVRTIALRYE